MSYELMIGLLLEITAVTLLLRKTREHWLSHVGVIFILISFVYYGVWEVVQIIFPGRNLYRILVSQEDVDAWVCIVGVAMLLFAIAYCIKLGNVERSIDDPAHLRQWSERNLVDWRIFLALAIYGYGSMMSDSQQEYWADSIAKYMTVFAIIIACVSAVFRFGPHATLPVLAMQSLILMLIDSRRMVLMSGIIMLSMLQRFGIRIYWRQLVTFGMISSVVMVGISTARAVVGRINDQEGTANAEERLQWIMDGMINLTDSALMEDAVADDFIYRCDGNAFNGMIYHKLANGCPFAGFQPLWNNFILAVPRFIYIDKFDTNVLVRNEEAYMVAHYRLPEDIDYTPGTIGILFSYYGPYGVWVLMVVLGWFYAKVDRWLAMTHSTLTFFMGLGFVSTSVAIEAGVSGYFITFRNIISIYFLCMCVVGIHRIFHVNSAAAPWMPQSRREHQHSLFRG